MRENVSNIQTYDLFWKRKLKSIKDISYSNDGTHIIVGLDDGRVYLFNNDGSEIWQKKVTNVTCIDISGDSSKIAIGTKNGSLYILSNSGTREWEQKIMGSINSLSISNNGKLICVGTNRGIIFCFDGAGNELWKSKIKGPLDGGISYSADGQFIAVGSWNTVYLLTIEGEDVWKFKFNKKINDVAVANDGSYIATCTKGSFAIISDGTLVHEEIIPNGFNSVSICENHIYAASSNTIFTFDENGQNIGKLDTPECLEKICINASKEFITTNSENRIYVLSSLMKPDITFLTDKLSYGEEQTLKIEIANKSPKEINLELELISDSLEINTSKSTINVSPNEKSIIEFDVTPHKLGEINVDLQINNKKTNSRKIIEIVPPNVELNINLHPKYDFNAEDDEITILIDIENVGKVMAKNIRVEGYENLSLPELETGSTDTLVYKIKLPSGDHNLSNRLICEDEIGNKSPFECSCEIHVEKAPFVWVIKQPITKLIPGKTTTVDFNVKNIKNENLNLILNITSDKIEISPTNIQVNVNSLESKDIAFEFTPKESGKNIDLDVAIEYDEKIQTYQDSIKVDPKPPDIQVVGQSHQKDKYRVGEEVYETIELVNAGESKATNIQIPGLPIIPELEKGETKIVNITKQSDVAKHYKSEIILIQYQDGEYCTEFTSKAYTVLSPEIRIRVPETHLQENIKKVITIDCENISGGILNDLSVEFVINGDDISLDKEDVKIDKMSLNTTKSIPFEILANKEGEVNYDIIVKKDGSSIEKHSGIFVVTSKIPILKFQVDDSGLSQNNYSPIKVKLFNNGNGIATNISLKLKTDINTKSKLEKTYTESKDLMEIKPGESKEIEFFFFPINPGKLPVNILSSFFDLFGKKLPEQDDEFVVQIKEYHQESKSEGNIIYNIKEYTHTKEGGIEIGGDGVVQNSNASSGNKNTSDSPPQEKKIESISFEEYEHTEGGIHIGGDGVVQNSHASSGNTLDSGDCKTYRASCIEAYKDGKISKTERECLDEQAIEFCLTEAVKNQIENEVFSNQNEDTTGLEVYRKQSCKAYSKGYVDDDVKNILDVLRVSQGLTREQQKEIDDEMLKKYSTNHSSDNDSNIKCSNCNKINNSNTKFCAECGVQLP